MTLRRSWSCLKDSVPGGLSNAPVVKMREIHLGSAGAPDGGLRGHSPHDSARKRLILACIDAAPPRYAVRRAVSAGFSDFNILRGFT
jgi:hypothetical protein